MEWFLQQLILKKSQAYIGTALYSTLQPFDTLEVQGNNQWHGIQQAQMLGNAGQTQIILFLTIVNDPHHWKESNHLQIYL